MSITEFAEQMAQRAEELAAMPDDAERRIGRIQAYRHMADELRSAARNVERNSTNPPAHWKPEDGWNRHPQRMEQWNWKNDGERSIIAGTSTVEDSPLNRSIKRLNFAADQADPSAPDQMATVLRIDLTRLLHEHVSLRAYKNMKIAETCKPGAC